MIAAADAEMMIADVDVNVKGTVADAAITQAAAAETTIPQTTMDVTADQISVPNPALSKDLFYSIRI